MQKRIVSRRKFGASIVAASAVGLAGCMGDDDDEDDDEDDDDEDDDEIDLEVDDVGDLTVMLENEDGDTVSQGVEVTATHEEENFSESAGAEIAEGVATFGGLLYQGEYTVTVTSLEDEFDEQEETIEMGEDDEELEFVLEGATGDSELEE